MHVMHKVFEWLTECEGAKWELNQWATKQAGSKWAKSTSPQLERELFTQVVNEGFGCKSKTLITNLPAAIQFQLNRISSFIKMQEVRS